MQTNKEIIKNESKFICHGYDPKTIRFPYPSQTDQHYIPCKKTRNVTIDENYKYVNNKGLLKLGKGVVRVLLFVIVFPVMVVRLGLKIKGKENLKTYKKELENGAVSVSNHVHMWDYIANMLALKKHRLNLLAWSKNVEGENGALIRAVGGIPIPENNLKASKAFSNAVEDLLHKNKWVHIYAEGSMWEYYAPIRPFKLGASYFAVKANKPILPLAFSYRKPSWFRRLIKQPAAITLTIGKPIFPNLELGLKEAEIDLTIRVHNEICKLAGIKEEDNLYNPIFDKDTRVDYYADTYGKGYKKSY